ncbi:TAXI family TRAP transporter solute-binding subunit [Bacillus aerolatus]|nr:TAXI family TRAP transporter solute-binding subunit [Bacillus aerolatus]
MNSLKKKVNLILVLIGSLVLALAGCSDGNSAAEGEGAKKDNYKPVPNNITLASGPIGGGWYQTGASVAEILMKEIPGLNVTVIEGGSESNIRDVANGSAHIGYTFSDSINDAVNGAGVFEDGAIGNVSGIASLYTSYYQAFAVENSKYDTFKDLSKGAHLLPGMKNWGGELVTKAILKHYDVSYKDIEKNGGKVSYTTFGDMPSLLADGHADVAMGITAAPSSMVMELNALKGVKFLEVPKEIAEDIQKNNAGFIPAQLPANTYEGQKEPVDTLASYSVIFASNDLPEELVERISRAIVENKDELIKNNEPMKDFKEEDILKGFKGVPIHPGAEKVYE